MFKTSIFCLLVVLTISFNVIAIDETESIRQRSQEKPNFTNIAIDLSGKKGNSETENIALGIYHSQRFDKHFGYIMATREYSDSNGQKSADNAFLHVRYNYYFSPKNSVEVYAQTNVDDFRSLESRELFGLGYRYEMTRHSAYGIGLFNEHENYLVEGEHLTFNQARINLYWVHAQKLNKHATLTNTLYYQPNVEEFGDWRAFNKFSISSRLTKHLSMSFGLLVEHDSQPVLNVEATDISYEAGFEIDF
ncbi:hypothetical protein GCM10008107_16170 [Psychrosphaera saromensis]|uniref:DUF481 domain-containing protein n=1 Tax=Psychrosphaera saromensis TaxID=716813 RepID=A0A2S7UTV8_9GAMM|nr:DUF481 domain-containing protein [Psychrosphaera saromensis]PQJ53169.1 hypothetical protein BTO11_05475 [Psychrosphaera saromensis]GHB67486.1 hypothetical protein GCM10008107_16170 [Psychrosphaera saromensis]GLQ15073.1 hypothetical protein GCM10007917_25280 [Psychrosphaera saromensis]